ncbi:MAG: uL15m family ribosomal protein [Thermoplasmata archaeon]
MSYSRGRKFRGYRRHGHGMKGRRGHGLKGGKGLSGLGKHKWIWLNKYFREHWGRHGFTSHHPKRIDKTINLEDLQYQLQRFSDIGIARNESGTWYIDLTSTGVTKLLGKGEVRHKMIIKVNKASQGAIKKLREAGGEVELNA